MAPPPVTVSADALHHERMWSVFAPPLVAEPGLPLFALSDADRAVLDTAPREAVPLHRRLGRRFEAHWRWAFDRLDAWTVLGDGIQVRDGRRTAGELDLLVSGPGGVWHLELAIKFYLCLRGHPGDDEADWVGPGGRDRLDRKLHRMRTHQVPMGAHTLTRDALTARGLPLPDHSAAILRGVCFADWTAPHPAAAGLWCPADEQPRALPEARLLRRTEWLGFAPPSDADRQAGADLAAAIAKEHRRGAAQLVDPAGRRWLVLPPPH